MSEREPWEIDVVSALERRIAAHGARPDFLDVVERAHALDPVAVPEEALAQADALAIAAAEAEAEARGSADDEAVVDAWLHDVRAAVERKVEERRERALEPLPAPSARRGVWWLVGAAVAAAALLVVGVGQVVRMVADPVEPAEQALHMNDGTGATGTADAVEPRRHEVATPRRTSTDERPEPVVVPEPVEPVEAEAVETAASEPEPAALAEAAATPSRTSATRSDRDRDRFAALAEAAQAHWRAGRRAEAQRLFAKIVAEAGRARAAEMAYADLFTLASQSADVAAQRQWWKSYLRRFPRGRFADDARAGLCREAAGERVTCWQAYLDDFPHGSFRGEARVALGKGPE